MCAILSESHANFPAERQCFPLVCGSGIFGSDKFWNGSALKRQEESQILRGRKMLLDSDSCNFKRQEVFCDICLLLEALFHISYKLYTHDWDPDRNTLPLKVCPSYF